MPCASVGQAICSHAPSISIGAAYRDTVVGMTRAPGFRNRPRAVGDESDHALSEAEVPKCLGDEDVRTLGQLDLVRVSLHELDPVAQAIGADELFGETGDWRPARSHTRSPRRPGRQNIARIPVPAPRSTTISPVLTVSSMACRRLCVRTSSASMPRWYGAASSRSQSPLVGRLRQGSVDSHAFLDGPAARGGSQATAATGGQLPRSGAASRNRAAALDRLRLAQVTGNLIVNAIELRRRRRGPRREGRHRRSPPPHRSSTARRRPPSRRPLAQPLRHSNRGRPARPSHTRRTESGRNCNASPRTAGCNVGCASARQIHTAVSPYLTGVCAEMARRGGQVG